MIVAITTSPFLFEITSDCLKRWLDGLELETVGTVRAEDQSRQPEPDSEPEAHPQRRQPGNRLVAHFHYARLVGRGVVLESRVKRTGVLTV